MANQTFRDRAILALKALVHLVTNEPAEAGVIRRRHWGASGPVRR